MTKIKILLMTLVLSLSLLFLIPTKESKAFSSTSLTSYRTLTNSTYITLEAHDKIIIYDIGYIYTSNPSIFTASNNGRPFFSFTGNGVSITYNYNHSLSSTNNYLSLSTTSTNTSVINMTVETQTNGLKNLVFTTKAQIVSFSFSNIVSGGVFNTMENKIFYIVNVNDRYDEGYDDGFVDGDEYGYSNGYDIGYDDGLLDGTNNDNNFKFGYDQGYNTGYGKGYDAGQDAGFTDGVKTGATTGYIDGYEDAKAEYQDPSNYGFLGLFTGIADTPYMILTSLLSFEVFGMSAFSILFGILTLLIIIWLIKRFMV